MKGNNEMKNKIYDSIHNLDFMFKRNAVLRDPDKMTFDPDFAAIQDLHKRMLANTSLLHYLKYNYDAKAQLLFFLYLVVVAFSLILLYLTEYATTF